MGLFDNLDQLAQPGLSPLQSMLLGGVNAVAPYANTTATPTSPWAALGAAAGGMGQGIQDQRAQALKQMLGAAQVQRAGLEAHGLQTQNTLGDLSLATQLDIRNRYGNPATKGGSVGASMGDAAPAAAPVAPAVTPAVTPASTPASTSAAVPAVDLAPGANNVGNIRTTDTQWDGEVPGLGGGFKTFQTPEHGVAAVAKNLQAYGKQGYDTLNTIIPRWSPASDNNKPDDLIKNMSLRTGFSPDQKLDLNDPATLAKLAKGFAVQEGRVRNLTADQITRGVSMAFDRQQQPPPASTAPGIDGVVQRATTSGAQPAAAAPLALSPQALFSLEQDADIVKRYAGQVGGEKFAEAAQHRLDKATPDGSYLGRDPQTGRIGLYRIPGADEGDASKALAIERAVNPEKTRQAIDQAHQMVAVEKERQEALMPGAIKQAGGIKSAETTAASDARLAPAPTTPGLDTRNMSREEAEALLKSRGGDTGNDASQKVAYAKQWRDQFTPVIDKARELNKQANVVNLALDQKNGTGDIAAITAFNKLLDEGVSVHESDIRNTLMAQGIVEQLNTWVKNKREGDMLDDPLRDKIRTLSNALHASSNEYYRQQVESYRPAIEGKPETGGMGLNYDHIVPPALRRQLKWDTPAPPPGADPAAAATHIWNPATGTVDPVQ